MRHVCISGQNNLSSFKNQVGNILKELNSFSKHEKNEAMTYLKNCINSGSSSSSQAYVEANIYNKSRIKTNGVLYKSKFTKAKKRCDKIKTLKYCSITAVSLKKNNFKCIICNTTTKTKKNMLKHVETHVGAPLSCIKCRRTFNGSIPFKWHLKYYCKSASNLKFKYKCGQCSREFTSKRTLDSHIQGHKRNNCLYCDKVLTRRVHLMKHLLEAHSIKLERNVHKCDYCEKRYIKKGSLYYHLRQHLPNKFICLECGHSNDTIDQYEEHKKSHDVQKHFKCTRCDERFSRRQQYLYHLKRHNQYKCVTCNESYASRGKVIKHKQLGHQVQGLNPRFICPHCSAAYFREDRFHIHMRKHTDDNRTINCKYCKKTFTSPYAYYKHCLTVSHERFSPEMNDIVCDKCEKHFSKRYHFRQHMYRVHNISKQIIVCQYCNYKSAHKSNMDRHVALHFKKNQQFTCEYCGKTCESIASLNDHITYNHIQEKQFKCDKCDKSFKRNSELVRHQDSHSDERPHVCTMCGKAYKRVNHLKRHEERAHQIVKESRRIKKIITESENKIFQDSNIETQLYSNTKIVFLQSVLNEGKPDNVLINFSNNSITESGNVMEQLTFIAPDRDWNIDNEDLCKIYNDVNLNDGTVVQEDQINGQNY